MDSTGQAYAGRIVSTQDIAGADRIVLATAVCGSGGRWRGVVPKDIDPEHVIVVLPDSIVPHTDQFAFMERYKYLVRQRRFKGVPSEALIVADPERHPIGTDVSALLGITKYMKPLLSADAKGSFPGFLPKTDEPLVQRVDFMLEYLRDQPYRITLKMDGSSTTAFKYHGAFGVCSRNLEIKDGHNAYWEVARKYNLEDELPEGYAVQWETCGPKIQKNPLGLSAVDGYAFQAWDIARRCYVDEYSYMQEVPLIETGEKFQYSIDDLQALATRQTYRCGVPAEGIVVRSPLDCAVPDKNGVTHRLSFKVINLEYTM